MPRITLWGIPRSLVAGGRRLLSGSLGDVLWKLLIVSLLLLGGYVLIAAGGIFGAAVGGILLSTLLADDVRAFVGDVWHRRWARIKLPF